MQAYKLRLSVAPDFKIQREVRISVDRCSKNKFEIYINFFPVQFQLAKKLNAKVWTLMHISETLVILS